MTKLEFLEIIGKVSNDCADSVTMNLTFTKIRFKENDVTVTFQPKRERASVKMTPEETYTTDNPYRFREILEDALAPRTVVWNQVED